MIVKNSIRDLRCGFSEFVRNNTSLHIPKRDFLNGYHCLDENAPKLSSMERNNLFTRTYVLFASHKSYMPVGPLLGEPCNPSPVRILTLQRQYIAGPCDALLPWLHVRHISNSSIELQTDNDVVKFSIGMQHVNDRNQAEEKKTMRRIKMSKKAKRNELRLYRLKAKKKMNSPNPEVRIRYKLGKAKRKEEWLIEKLRKFEAPKAPVETYDPELLTEEERFYLKRTGEKKKNYVPVGRRGVFGGVVLNMHLHWKNHETVKVVCKPCKPGQIHMGKNYVQPKILSPPDTLSKAKALEKYKIEQSLEHTSQFIEKLEEELEEYHKHLARYKKGKENTPHASVLDT